VLSPPQAPKIETDNDLVALIEDRRLSKKALLGKQNFALKRLT